MNIKLATVNLEVADPQNSKRFYIDVLGLTENAQRSQPPQFVYLDSGGAAITLAAPHSGTTAQPSPAMELGFEVDELAAVRERLAAQHVTGFVPQSMGWGDVLEGRDLDGYRVIIYAFKR